MELLLQLILSSLNQISKTNNLKFVVNYFPNFGSLFYWQSSLLFINDFRHCLWWNLPHKFFCEKKLIFRLLPIRRFAQFIIISWTLLKNWRWSGVLVRIIVTVLLYLICNFTARQLINFLTLNLLTLIFRCGHMLNIVDLIFLFKPRWKHLITRWGS